MFCDQQQYHNRLALIDGFARQFNVNGSNGVLPMAVNAIVRNYADDVVYWMLNGDTLSELLSSNTNNFRVVNESVYNIGGVSFQLSVQNKNGNLLFQVMLLQNQNNHNDHDDSKPACEYEFVYVELYCLQTQTQFKHTFEPFLERNGNKNYSAISWGDHHLNVSQCANKQQLTFSVYLKPLLCHPANHSMLDECRYELEQYQYEYKWNLLPYKHTDSQQRSRCKVYSPNFTDRDNSCCWCLWYEPLPVTVAANSSLNDVSNSNSNANETNSVCVGLQLLNLPPGLMKKGLLFQCTMEYEVRSNERECVQKEYKFTYFLNVFQNVVTIKNFRLDEIAWIKVRINPLAVDDDDDETSDDGEDELEFMDTIHDYQYVANISANDTMQSTYSAIPSDHDWFMIVTKTNRQDESKQIQPSVYLLDVTQDWNFRV